MQTKRSRASRLTNKTLQRQTRAIVNLQQLSESPWHHPYDQHPRNQQPIIEQKTYTNTLQSTQLPLHPKQPVYQQHKRTPNHHYMSLNKQRPNTIHNSSLDPSPQVTRLSKKIHQPLTSLNFYDDTKRSYNTFDDRSRLNEQIELFASRIRHEGNLIQSMEMTRARTSGIKQPSATLPYKANIAKRSFFYKQFKNFLYSSFQVSGKPVQIKRDKYSIQSHGLPKKKSIYSFKEKNTSTDFFAFNKTDVLRKKVGRYDMDGQNEETKQRQQRSTKKKSVSLYDEMSKPFVNQTLHVRGNDKYQNKKMKGKLFLGRPPTTLVLQQG